jgi:hypothetical protein
MRLFRVSYQLRIAVTRGPDHQRPQQHASAGGRRSCEALGLRLSGLGPREAQYSRDNGHSVSG